MTDLGVRPPADALKGTLYGAKHVGVPVTGGIVQGTLTATHLCPQVEYTIIEPDGAPPWLQVMVADINRVAQLPPGWDSYGADQLQLKAAIHALELLERMDFGGPAPWVSPSKDGGLHLEWDRGGVGLELEVTDHGDVDVVFEVDGDISEWTTSSLGDEQLRAVLSQISAV